MPGYSSVPGHTQPWGTSVFNGVRQGATGTSFHAEQQRVDGASRAVNTDLPALFGGLADGTSTATGALVVAKALAGQSDGTSTTTAALSTSGFLPTDIPGCLGWWDPSDSAVTGGGADNFNRADGALGADWSISSNAGGGGYVISSGVVHNINLVDSVAMWNHDLGSPNHYAEADVNLAGAGATYVDVFVRRSVSTYGADCYMGYLDPGANLAWIAKGQSGFFNLASGVIAHGGVGRLRLEAQGTALRLYVNGALVVSTTDSSITTGNFAGINGGGSGTAHSWDNFRAGALGAANVTAITDKSGAGRTLTTVTNGGTVTTAVASHPSIAKAGNSYLAYASGAPTLITGPTATAAMAYKRTADGTFIRGVSLGKLDDSDWNRSQYAAAVSQENDVAGFPSSNRGGGVKSGFITGLDAWHACIMVYDGSTARMYLDGTASPLNPADTNGNFAVQDIILGNEPPTFASPFIGEIGDVVVYNTALNSTQRTDLFKYLNDKWGIAHVAGPVALAGSAAGTSTATGTLTVPGTFPSVADDFNRADGAVGSNWVKPGASEVLIAQIVGQRVTAPAPLTTYYAALWATGGFGAYQSAQIDGALGGDYSEINALLRYATTQNGYNFAWVTNGVLLPSESVAGYACQIWRGTGGGGVNDYALVAECPGPSTGIHRLKAFALGTRLVLMMDGVVMIDTVDLSGTVPVAGVPGISPHQGGAAGTTYIDNFLADGYDATALPTIPAPTSTFDFTGADGAAWPSPWSLLAGVGTHSATIQGNKGEQNLGAGGTTYRADTMPWAPDDYEFYADFDVTTGQGMTFRLLSRLGGGFQRQTYVEASIDGGYVNIVTTTDGAANTIVVATKAFTFATGTYHLRVHVFENTIIAKVWSGSSEPANWTVQGATLDRTAADDTIGLVALRSATGGPSVIRWDNIAVRDQTLTPLPPPTGGPVALAGTSAGLSASSGSLVAATALAGTAAGASTTTGALALARPLAGTAAGASTTTGALGSARPLAGTSDGTSTASGVLSVGRALAGSVAGSSTTTGALVTALAVAGTSAGLSTDSGALVLARALAATAAGVATAAASTLVSARGLAGTADGTSTAVASTLVGTRTLDGSSSGTSAASGSMTVLTAGNSGVASGTSTAVGALSVAKTLAGTAAGLSTVAAALALARPLAGRADGVAAAGATTLVRLLALVGVAVGASSTTGSLTTAAALARMKVWNGAAFVDGSVKAWNGTAFVDAVGVKTWNGSAFV